MSTLSLKYKMTGEVEDVIRKVSEGLKEEGFGVLTRIDLHTKIKEKLGKELAPTVILGVCNPNMAYEAYQLNPDVASLLPCNVVIKKIASNKTSVEIAKPTTLLKILEDERLTALSQEAERRLEHALRTFKDKAAA